MGDLHTVGPAGGAGGEQDVAAVVGRGDAAGRAAGVRERRPVDASSQLDRPVAGGTGGGTRARPTGEHDPGPGGADDVRSWAAGATPTSCGTYAAPAFSVAEHAHQHRDRAAHEQADVVAGPHARPDQPGGERLGVAVQLAVGDASRPGARRPRRAGWRRPAVRRRGAGAGRGRGRWGPGRTAGRGAGHVGSSDAEAWSGGLLAVSSVGLPHAARPRVDAAVSGGHARVSNAVRSRASAARSESVVRLHSTLNEAAIGQEKNAMSHMWRFSSQQATSMPVGDDLKAGRRVPHAGGPGCLTRPGGGGEVPVPAA